MAFYSIIDLIREPFNDARREAGGRRSQQSITFSWGDHSIDGGGKKDGLPKQEAILTLSLLLLLLESISNYFANLSKIIGQINDSRLLLE